MPYQIRLQPDYLIRPRGGGIIPLRGDVARRGAMPRNIEIDFWALSRAAALSPVQQYFAPRPAGGIGVTETRTRTTRMQNEPSTI